jgi:hypothetical protein
MGNDSRSPGVFVVEGIVPFFDRTVFHDNTLSTRIETYTLMCGRCVRAEGRLFIGADSSWVPFDGTGAIPTR